MRAFFLALFLITSVIFSPAHAKEYGYYNIERIFIESETPSGKQYAISGNYLDQIMNDLALHAKYYPPQFDTPEDRQRAIRDVTILSGMLDIIVKDPNPHPEILLRAGFVNSIGYNLDIAGSSEKTISIFQKLLKVDPGNPQGNYLYGLFLAGANKQTEALPYVQKAIAADIVDAIYTLGMIYLSLGEKQKALEALESYKQRNPKDDNTSKIIEAIRNGRIEFKKSPS
jgi:tetratricopeptide (TPR) repeat protein